MKIEYVKGQDLHAAPWRSVHVLKPDLEVLSRSMQEYGWIQPILVQSETNMIIDGHYRWEIAGSVKSLKKEDIPVIYASCSDQEAMMIHLRLNRGRGQVTAKGMSNIIRNLLKSRRYNEDDLRKTLVMKSDEIDLMVDGSLIKMRKVAQHTYSKAWVPVEAPASITETSAIIERPPNADR